MICQWRADQLFAKVLFNEYLREAKRSAFFFRQERSQEGETWFRLRMSRILFAAKLLSQTQSQNQLDDIADEQTIICRGLN